MGPRFKVSSKRSEMWEIYLVTPGLVVQHVIDCTTAAPSLPGTLGEDWSFRREEIHSEKNNFVRETHYEREDKCCDQTDLL